MTLTFPEIILMEAGLSFLGLGDLVERAVLHSFDITIVQEMRDTAPEFRRPIFVNRGWATCQDGIAACPQQVYDLIDVVGLHHELFKAELTVIRSSLSRTIRFWCAGCCRPREPVVPPVRGCRGWP